MSFLIPFVFHEGDRLEGMTIVTPLVRGGHGELYLVRDEEERMLALKVIRKMDEGELTGIEKCRAVSSHIPGLVPILKTGKLFDGRIWCVMPPADNLARWPDYEPDTLASRIERAGRLSPEDVLEIIGELLTTIRSVHEAGLAHCDIKPENIVFIDGKPKLTDYSLLSDAMTRPPDAPFGTIGFIPPEMLDNSDSFVPKACDLYATGKILYCAWSGMDAESFPSIPREIPFREIGVMLPLYIKACSDSPNGRFKTAEEFLSSVEAAHARLHSRFPIRGWKAFGRRGWFFLAGTLLILCSTVLANIVFFSFFWRGETNRNPLEVTTVKDVVDESDGVNSLREALEYARARGIQTISFNMPDGNTILLNEPALFTKNIRIAPTNKATGNPVNIVLDHLDVSKKALSTSETEEGGGAVLYSNGGCFTINGGLYADNMDKGLGGLGGAIRIVNGTLTIDGTTFKRNYAYSAGGAVNVDYTRVLIRKSIFDGNSSVGHGGAIDLYCSTARIIDSTFTSNSTKENPLYCWRGGAIQVDGSDLVYEVTPGAAITNIGNESGLGGFIVLCGAGGKAAAEFRIDGSLNIGRGDGLDSFGSLYYDEINPDNNEKKMFVRKTGGGVMTINAPVSDYDEQWIVEDGVLVFNYAPGGDFDGKIAISGGHMRFDGPYRFRSLTFRLGDRINAQPYVGNLSNLTGGIFIADVSQAADGVYQLADGADGFNGPIMLQYQAAQPPTRIPEASADSFNDRAMSSTELSVGQTMSIGDSAYTLSLNSGLLSLTVESVRK